MTQDEIRAYLARDARVVVQVAAEGDGSPAIAWGDTFFYVRDKDGVAKKMPFVTMVTKDYAGFESDSQLDRGGLFRLNLDVGRERAAALFGWTPGASIDHRAGFDFTALNTLFPNPTYGASGWVSIINPEGEQTPLVTSLLDEALTRALR